MMLLGTLIIGLAQIISLVIRIYSYVVIASAVVSWINADPSNPIVQTIHKLTQPVFTWVRRKLPASLYRTGLDLSPMIVLLVLLFLQYVLTTSLLDLGYRLRQGVVI